MTNDLTDDTTDTTRPQPRAKGATSVCGHCLVDDHQLCTGLGCYGCPPENHPRKPGTSSLGPTLAEHPPAGHATDHKPAHTRGRA